jgi:ketosteroid isomerase-like protein
VKSEGNQETPMDELVKTWLEEYQAAIQSGDVEEGFPLFAENATLFGTRVNWSRYLPEYAKKQWHPIWSTSNNFVFSEILTISSFGESAYCAVLWKNTTKINGLETERFGRATFVLQIQDGNFVAIHSHFSESPAN